MQQVTDERSLGELFSELAQETRTLISQEVELAKIEMSQKAGKAGKGAGYAAAGGLVIYAGALFVILGVVLALGEAIPLWAAALVVGVIVALIGYALTRKGIGDVKSVNLKPERTLSGIQEDKRWIQERAQ